MMMMMMMMNYGSNSRDHLNRSDFTVVRSLGMFSVL